MTRIGEGLARAAAVVWNAFWAIAVGIIALWAFFVAMGAVDLSDPLWLTIAIVVIGTLAIVHFAHVRRMLGDHEHADDARRVHMLRERRGF